MIEDVRVQVEVVEALRGEHHANIITPVEERQGLQEELLTGNLHHTDIVPSQQLDHILADIAAGPSSLQALRKSEMTLPGQIVLHLKDEIKHFWL